MKFHLKGIKLPTPKKIVKLANAILATSLFIGTSALVQNHPIVGTFCIIVGGICKGLSYFFSEDNVINNENE